jgi:hypothetical protein
MARAPNYSFERQERERQKALKLAQKAQAKREQRERTAKPDDDGANGRSDES